MSFNINNIPVISPTGNIIMFPGTISPDGWFFCDGSSYSNATYSDLYSILGTTYGSGTGTFNVPDLRNQFIYGASSTTSLTNTKSGITNGMVTLTQANMPSHNHTGTTNSGSAALSSSHSHNCQGGKIDNLDMNGGALPTVMTGGSATNVGSVSTELNFTTSTGHTHIFTTSSVGSATSFNITPPNKIMNFIIKY